MVLTLFAGLALFGFSGWYLYSNVWTNPDRLLSDMIEKSIQTPSVERVVSQKSQQSSVNQVVYLSFAPTLAVHSSTTLEEVARVGEATSVVTETIGTVDRDYVRYTEINVPQKQGQKDDFSDITGQWGKREKNEEKSEQVTFLDEALFSIVPFGNLNDEQRLALLAEIQNADPYKYDRAERQFQDGRPIMVYSMNINTQSLVRVLAKYVELTGAGDASQLDPEQYENAPPLRVTFAIDIMSRHLRQIDFGGTGRTEEYAAYGLKREIKLPEQTIAVDELQSRLQKLQ